MQTFGTNVVRLLERIGISQAFGIPGIHNAELYRGLSGSTIRHTTPRHEQGAGFMADGYARVSGRPAACFIVSGPGMTNIATAMGQAYADSIPMLVISSVVARAELGTGNGYLHELTSQRELAARVSAFSHTLRRCARTAACRSTARSPSFTAPVCGPVHIEIPVDLLAEMAEPRQPTRSLEPAWTEPSGDPARCRAAGREPGTSHSRGRRRGGLRFSSSKPSPNISTRLLSR